MLYKSIASLYLALIAFSSYAADGSNEDMKGVCELAGGNFHQTVEGTWACCWPDWGCYGCIQSVCKMKCETERCRRANGQSSTVQPGYTRPKGFDQFGVAPVVPAVSQEPTPPKSIKNTAPGTKLQQ